MNRRVRSAKARTQLKANAFSDYPNGVPYESARQFLWRVTIGWTEGGLLRSESGQIVTWSLKRANNGRR